MARAERIGLAVALVGHALLFGALSLGWLVAPEPMKPTAQPIDVSLVKDVALEPAAPVVAPPAPSIAPEQGPPEDAAPPPEESEPEPAPAPPKPSPPKPAPEKPAPKHVPEKPAVKPQPAPKPTPVVKPTKKPEPEPPVAKAPSAKLKPTKAPSKTEIKPAKAAPAKSPPVKTASARSADAPGAPAKAKPTAITGKGNDAAARATRPRGSRLGDDFLKGLTDAPAKPAKPMAAAAAPSAAKIDAHALAGIQAAIARQIQPCADRQSDGGIPQDARQVVITFDLRLNADGSLASVPRIVRRQNVDGDNSRYVQQIADIGIAAFKGCSPLKLPAEYYSTAAGGWNHLNFNWQLR